MIGRTALHDRVPIADLIMVREQVTGAICSLSSTAMVSDGWRHTPVLIVVYSESISSVLYVALCVGITVIVSKEKQM